MRAQRRAKPPRHAATILISWTRTPTSDKIIFSSNLHYAKRIDFDLYSINIDGSGLERITFSNGFDGFPMFSPNGKHIVFASNRNQKKRRDTNLFLAKWNYK